MSDQETHASPYRIQSVYDAFGLLEVMVAANQPLTASQIATLTKDSRNRSFRLLKTLEECGYVKHSPVNRTYQPSLKLLTLGQAVSRNQSIELIARDVMKRLCDAIGETVYLTVREGYESVCVVTIESTQMVRISAQPGTRWLLGRGASGSALLVSAPEIVRNQFLIRYPEKHAQYLAAKDRYERDGVTYVDGRDGTIEDEGVLAIGVPIFDAHGHANHALATAWPFTRSSPDYNFLRSSLVEAVRAIERELGVSPEQLPSPV